MAGSKIRISSRLIFEKIALLTIALFFLKEFITSVNSNIESDFKEDLEVKIGLFISAVGFIYFFTRPHIYFDGGNLYVKKFSNPETVIPLKNIISISETAWRVNSILRIEYLGKNQHINKIWFHIDYTNEKIADLKAIVQNVNPDVEIV